LEHYSTQKLKLMFGHNYIILTSHTCDIFPMWDLTFL
jgi:hypothetical protein